MDFGQRVKAMREARGLTQKELAERASVSQPMVAQVERGSKSPSLAFADALAYALGVTIQDLICPDDRSA